MRMYVLFVAVAGSLALAASVMDLSRQPLNWTKIVALAALSGWATVPLYRVNGRVSPIAETFIMAATLMFGASVGAMAAFVVAGAMFLKITYLGARPRLIPLVFSLTSPPLIVWMAAYATGRGTPLIYSGTVDAAFVLNIAAFSACYFLLTTWSLALVVGLQTAVSPTRLWYGLKDLAIAYAAGAIVAAMLCIFGLTLWVLGFILPLLCVIHIACSWQSHGKEILALQAQRNTALRQE